MFSAKPNLPSGNNRSYLGFGASGSLFLDWSSGTFNYEIPNQIDRISINVDTTQFNHIAFEYVGNKLTVWVNGKSRKSYNINLPDLSSISINADQLGVLSLYGRELSKTEVAEHFVEYQEELLKRRSINLTFILKTSYKRRLKNILYYIKAWSTNLSPQLRLYIQT